MSNLGICAQTLCVRSSRCRWWSHLDHYPLQTHRGIAVLGTSSGTNGVLRDGGTNKVVGLLRYRGGSGPWTDHTPTDHPPTDHTLTDHPPTNHPPTDHPPTDHPPTHHPPTHHPPIHHPPTDQTPRTSLGTPHQIPSSLRQDSK